jgi:hypothetical protein
MLMPQLVLQLRVRDNPRDRFYGKLEQVLSQFPITEKKILSDIYE